jgi:hypothetical protein
MPPDHLLTRAEIVALLRVSSDTFRRWQKAEKVPPADVAPTRKTQQWKVSTLHAAGLRI